MRLDGGLNSGNYKNFLEFNKKLRESNENSIFKSSSKTDNNTSPVSNMMQEKKILAKIARGEKLTSKEKERLKEIPPEKLQQAKAAKKEKERIERELKSAQTKEDKEKILMNAKSMAVSASNEDNTYSELLLEAIDKAESNDKGKKKSKDEIGGNFNMSV